MRQLAVKRVKLAWSVTLADALALRGRTGGGTMDPDRALPSSPSSFPCPEIPLDPQELAAAARPDVFGRYLAELPRPPHHPPHGGHSESVREVEYEGRHIVIRTTYEITVDGRPLAAHLGVGDDGEVHCHALPAYQFLSAVDTVKALIAYFPDDFPPGPGYGEHGEHGHGEHGGHGAGHAGGG